MLHIIQEDFFRGTHFSQLVSALEKQSLPIETVSVVKGKPIDMKVYPFGSNIMLWGSSKLARYGKDLGYYPCSFMNDNHDYLVYGPKYGDHMFNRDSQIYSLYDKSVLLPDEFFARPTADSKAFEGKVYTKPMFEHTLSVLRDNIKADDFKYQIAPVKPIEQEIRFWVVKGEIVTASQYRFLGGTIYKQYHGLGGWSFAQTIVDIYEPAEAFTLDICKSRGGWYVMEINCINCSGFYHADMGKVVDALEINYNI